MGAPCHSGFHAGGRCAGGCSCSRGGSFVSSWICVGVSEVEGVGVNGSEAWRGGEGAAGGVVSVELHHQSQQVPTPVPMIGHFQPIPVLGRFGGSLLPGGFGGLPVPPVPPVSDCSSVSISGIVRMEPLICGTKEVRAPVCDPPCPKSIASPNPA